MDDLFTASLSPPAGVSPRKWARLAAFLGELPAASAARLFAALEKGAAAPGLPVPSMLQTLRIRLFSESGAFPARPPTAQRAFFTPFEDFFIAGRRGRKRRARIDRASLGPIWTVLMTDAACGRAKAAAEALDAAYGRGEPHADALLAPLFEAAAGCLSTLVAHAEENAAFRADLSARLCAGSEKGGAAALHDLAEIAMLAPLAPSLMEAQALFPRPLSSLTEEHLFAARGLYARSGAAANAGYLLHAIAARMDAPWRALRLCYFMMRADDGALPYARADAAQAADALVEDLEALARGLERDSDYDPDTDEAPARFAHFAEFAAGVIEEASREGDGATMRRAEACRDIAADALSRYAEAALAALRRNHPVRHAGGSSRLKGLRPDIARAPDRAAEKKARAGALFLAAAAGLGDRLERPDAAAAIAAGAIAETRRFAGDLILEIRASEGEERVAARRMMESVLRSGEPLLPADELALLKERANAAAVSA